MPSGAASGLLFKVFTRFPIDREAIYEGMLLTVRAGGVSVSTRTKAEYQTLISESRIYLRERGNACGSGVAVNADGTVTLTLFGA